jgi:hypothetical protein
MHPDRITLIRADWVHWVIDQAMVDCGVRNVLGCSYYTEANFTSLNEDMLIYYDNQHPTYQVKIERGVQEYAGISYLFPSPKDW